MEYDGVVDFAADRMVVVVAATAAVVAAVACAEHCDVPVGAFVAVVVEIATDAGGDACELGQGGLNLFQQNCQSEFHIGCRLVAAGSTMFEYSVQVEAAAGVAKLATEIRCFELVVVAGRFAAAAVEGY